MNKFKNRNNYDENTEDNVFWVEELLSLEEQYAPYRKESKELNVKKYKSISSDEKKEDELYVSLWFINSNYSNVNSNIDSS